MDWEEAVAAAHAISWVCYIGTADESGRPHVSVVAPGFTQGSLWAGTRPGTKKIRNLRQNPRASFYWPVHTGTGPGELTMRGVATIHEDLATKQHTWENVSFLYNLESFWQTPNNPDMVFIEVAIERASLLGPDFVRKVWKPAVQ